MRFMEYLWILAPAVCVRVGVHVCMCVWCKNVLVNFKEKVIWEKQ